MSRNIYVSPSQFEIGPITPPTRTHAPFAQAKQRVYMSATLGDDGSIERAFGIGISIVLASNHARVHRDARPLAVGVTQVDLTGLKLLLSNAAMALERPRTSAASTTKAGLGVEAWRIYDERQVTPHHVAAILRGRPLSALP